MSLLLDTSSVGRGIGGGGAAVMIRAIRQVQYAAFCGPVLVAAVAPVVQSAPVQHEPRPAVRQPARTLTVTPLVGLEQFPPVLGVSSLHVDTTRRNSLPTADYPYLTQVEAVEQFAVTQGWSIHADTTRRATLSTAEYPYLARSEAIEQFTIPALAWQGNAPARVWSLRLQPAQMQSAIAYTERDLAVAVPPLAWEPSLPDTTSRRTLAISEYPFLFKGEAVEQFAVPPLSWTGNWPDTTRRAHLKPSHLVDPLTFALQSLMVSVPALSWGPSYPDTTKRVALSTAVAVDGHSYALQSITFPALSWAPQFPDATRRLSLRTTDLPCIFRCEAVEQYAVPALSWQGYQPVRVWSLRLQPAHVHVPIAFADQALQVFVPPLAWGNTYPDITRRATLPVSVLPFTFRGEALEQFAPTLLWSAVYPDRTSRLSLTTAQLPTLFRTSTEAPALSWQPNYPSTTRRNALVTAQHPFFVHSEAIEQFAPKLLWNAFYPDTTRRARDISGGVRATSTTVWSNWDPFATPPTADVVVLVAADPNTIYVAADPSVVLVAADARSTTVTSTDFIVVVPPDVTGFKP